MTSSFDWGSSKKPRGSHRWPSRSVIAWKEQPASRRAGLSASTNVDLPLPCGPTISPHQLLAESRSTSFVADSPGGNRNDIAPGRVQQVEKGLVLREGGLREDEFMSARLAIWLLTCNL